MSGIIYRTFNNKTLMLVDSTYKGSPIICYTPDIMMISRETYERYLPYIRIKNEDCKVIILEDG